MQPDFHCRDTPTTAMRAASFTQSELASTTAHPPRRSQFQNSPTVRPSFITERLMRVGRFIFSERNRTEPSASNA